MRLLTPINNPAVAYPFYNGRGVNGIGDGFTLPTFSDIGTDDGGDSSSTSSNPSFGSNVVTGAAGGYAMGVSAALSSGSAIAGGIAGALTFAAPFAGPAAPVLLAFASLVGPVASMFKGCGATCTQATAIADKAGAALKQVSDTYWNAPVRYKAAQTAALYTINEVAQYINQACGNPALGAAGQRCISERTVRGGTAPWCPNPGHVGCDLFTTYYDPIANDTGVQPDPVQKDANGNVVSGGDSLFSGTATGAAPYLLAAAGIAAVLFLTADD